MKVAVLGPTDMSKFSFSGLSVKEAEARCRAVGKALAAAGHELLIIPDSGVAAIAAEAYRAAEGKKVIGFVPKGKDYPTKHLKPFLHLLDERVQTPGWCEASAKLTRSADLVVVLGLSAGVFVELAFTKWNKKFHDWNGSVVSFVDLPPVLDHELAQAGVKLKYVKSVEDLEAML